MCNRNFLNFYFISLVQHISSKTVNLEVGGKTQAGRASFWSSALQDRVQGEDEGGAVRGGELLNSQRRRDWKNVSVVQ